MLAKGRPRCVKGSPKDVCEGAAPEKESPHVRRALAL